MISVIEALHLIKQTTPLAAPVFIPLGKSVGQVLAEDIYADISIPHFNQSAMDGYAFRFADYQSSNEFVVSGEVAAGDVSTGAIQSAHAVRIFTGAPVPYELDTIVMQEKTVISNGKLLILDEFLKPGSNVRLEGDEIKKGELALPKNTFLTAAAIGFLASLGVTNVAVYPKPNVHIIVTGNELQQPGKPLQEGQVYESNSAMLQAVLEQIGISRSTVYFAGDKLDETIHHLSEALEKADLILVTGGVSVGTYDFVVKAAEACGVKQLFHKVAQRPGKPLYAGTKNGKMVFGLPGNPASVLTCFYHYVIVAIEGMTNRKNILQRKLFPLRQDFSKKIQLTQFLKALATDEGVMPLQGQESFRLRSFAAANCLIVLPPEKNDYHKGDLVEVLLLPYL